MYTILGRLLREYVQKCPPDAIRRVVPVLQGLFTVAIVSIHLFVPPTSGPANARPSGSYSIGQPPSDLLTAERGRGLNTPHPKPRPRRRARLSQARGVPPYLRLPLISSWVAARALSDRSAAWVGKVLSSYLPRKWRRKVTSEREREAEKAGAGYSGTGLGVPEAPRGGRRGSHSTLPNKSGPALLARRMRRGLEAQTNQTCALD